jgi:probable phosphoglycerate mutase
VNRLILARHGEAVSNVDGIVSGAPPGAGLSAGGQLQAVELGRRLAGEPIALGVSSRFARARETLEAALAGRDTVARLELPDLDEIDFGSFEGGPLEAYRAWAWAGEPNAPCPGGGETRVAVARRTAAALDVLLGRPEGVILVVGHALPLRYVLDAADGASPAAKIEHLEHATPHRLPRPQVEHAVETLLAWAEKPQFRDAVG